MERIYQIDGEKDGDTAFLGNYRALTAADALVQAQVWSRNFYTTYVVIAILPAH
ncbi:MAG TPA: hypothetical protein VLQ80_25865 [Candidatus Saccharimonadia bacterium]|nr:hypothetical protein [Candidatus Saccharimonadia bacterium]